jgi:di/tricarboxylate transporter
MHTAGMVPMGFFELAWAGVPICTVGLAYLIFVASRRLPRRLDPAARFEEQRREYTTNMRVDPDCRLIGSSIEEAGLRHLQGLFLVEIDRGTHIVTPVSPDEVICEGDHLVFAGVVSTIATLQRIPGLTAVEETTADLEMRDRRLIEAVVSNSSPLIGQSIRDASFRTMYDAAVIAVHRNGERVGGKIGDVVLRPGDTLLLQTGSGFLRVHRNSQDFFLVSEFDAPSRPSRGKRRIAVAVLAIMVVSVVSGLLPISIAAFLAAGGLVATRCLSGAQARQSVEWGILIVIGAGFGIAFAMEKTGTAGQLAQILLVTAGPYGPLVTLAVIYAATLLLAELLHHAAAAAIMFPVAIAAATQLGVEPRGFAMGVALAATCAFANPTTYQTHLIVYGPGGYRFADFVRVGLPLDVLCGAVALFCIPRAWPF